MKSILLIGLSRFGKHLLMKLSEMDLDVLLIDADEKKINDMMPYITDAQIGDSTNEAFIASLGVRNFDLCFVAIANDFQSSLETTANLKELGARLVVSRAERDVQAKFLLRNGADEILYPEKQIAKWAAIRYSSDHILDYIELDETHAIFEVTVPRAWRSKSIGEIDIRKHFNINIMALKKNGKMNMAITPDSVLTEDVTMLVLGEYRALQKCFHI